MRRDHQGKIIFSPHDLMNFMASRFVTWMDRRQLDDKSLQPDEVDASAQILQARGIEHEKRHLENLQHTEKRVIEIPDNRAQGLEATIQAMREGFDEIYQAQLQHDNFGGIADFLSKVDGQSKLGDWHYEVWDTKLAKKNNPAFVMQLCCYAEMLEAIQGRLPAKVGIVLGDGSESAVRTADYYFFYKQLKSSLFDYMAQFDPGIPPAEIVIPAICRWASHGEKILRDRDDLSLIANIKRVQINKLQQAGINTVKQLADCPNNSIKDMRAETFTALREQAQLQVKSRADGEPCYKVLAPEDGRRGLKLLPPEHELDVFFDMEGYTLSDPPLEYLFGATHIVSGKPDFWFRWAHDRQQERKAFEDFIDWASARWEQSQRRMHIYHYASYEVTAMKKLMQRYGTREQQVDDFLRNNVFVDLFTVVRQGLRVGEENYSIKSIEKFYRGKRGEAVATAIDSIVAYDRYLNELDEATRQDILQGILAYNQVDCDSTYELAVWLRTLQKKEGIHYQPTSTDNGEGKKAAPKLGTPKADCAALAQQLLSESPSIADEHARNRQEMLAYLLQFHEREDKPFWWEVFACAALTQDELVEHTECLGWLKFVREVPKTGGQRKSRLEYKFDPQDTTITAGADCMCSHDLSKCKVEELDEQRGSIVILPSFSPAPSVLGLIPAEQIRKEKLQEALCQIVGQWRTSGRLPEAIEHFLDRAEPRIAGKVRGTAIFDDDASPVDQACDLAINMNRTTLCIQGPPGCGKTFAAAEMICRLMSLGKKIAITSNSHPAIENLLRAASRCARNKSQVFRGFKAGSNTFTDYCVRHVDDIKGLLASGDFDVIGGTAWKFCVTDAADKFDYLIVDEAGQVCVANLVAMSRCAKNIVLLGDQMQLEQPCQGVHPGESGKSILEYYLQEHATIPPEMGVFLPRTWRMHPDLCKLVSGAVYEDRLQSELITAKRVLKLPAEPLHMVAAESGILYVPVVHDGNTQSSEEEVACVRRIIDELLQCSLIDDKGKLRPFAIDDVLVVAPYNLQVRALRAGLQSNVRVGTVDKFQGQEAAVSILSMTASDANASPRGLSFLFDKHRLNVALSRAQILSIVVGNPALASTKCSTVSSMQLVNFYCRIVEQGSRRPLATSLS